MGEEGGRVLVSFVRKISAHITRFVSKEKEEALFKVKF